MPRRKTNFEKNHYYHIYNRGVNKSRIFFEEENYLFLLSKIKKYKGQFDISVIAYCLMPNHYHFLLRQNDSEGISKFIQSVFNSYTKAINNKYDRSGTLFEGRFKAISIDERDYLIHLCSYIHRNPIEANISKKLGSWPYSNLSEWLDRRNGSIFDRSFRDEYFKSAKGYLKFLQGYDLPDKAHKYIFENK